MEYEQEVCALCMLSVEGGRLDYREVPIMSQMCSRDDDSDIDLEGLQGDAMKCAVLQGVHALLTAGEKYPLYVCTSRGKVGDHSIAVLTLLWW